MVIKSDIPKDKIETIRSKNYNSLIQSSKQKWKTEDMFDPEKLYVGEVDNETHDNNNLISNLCVLVPSLLLIGGFLYNTIKTRRNKKLPENIIKNYNSNNLYNTSNVSDASFEIIDC